ncbi:MAG TPA: DUF2059 domain-containing protein [Rhodanobacter sp.]
MRKWSGFAAGIVLAVAAGGQALAAQPSEQQVRRLLELMHMDQMFGQMNSQVAGLMGQSMPCVPASYWQNFIDADGTEQLLKQMVPVYQRHFTAADVAGLLKFYQSPLGQKVITQMPITMAEGMKVGQQWGQQRADEMVKELQKKGLLNAQGRCPASPAAGAPKLVPESGS